MSCDVDSVSVYVEIPKGSRNKYEYDEHTKAIRFDRMISSSVHYPTDYGFIPNTLAGDGDPLDALVLLWEPTFPGCMIEARPLGVFRMKDEKGLDEKILTVPLTDPQWNHLKHLSEVPPNLLREIEHFFSVYKELDGIEVETMGWGELEEASKVIEESKQNYQKK